MGESESCFWSEQGQESCSLDIPTQQWRSLTQKHLGWERLVKETWEIFRLILARTLYLKPRTWWWVWWRISRLCPEEHIINLLMVVVLLVVTQNSLPHTQAGWVFLLHTYTQTQDNHAPWWNPTACSPTHSPSPGLQCPAFYTYAREGRLITSLRKVESWEAQTLAWDTEDMDLDSKSTPS